MQRNIDAFHASQPWATPENSLTGIRSHVPQATDHAARGLTRSRTGTIFAASAVTLAAAALYNTYRAHKAEREHPPAGRFVMVDGVRLHYIERGEGAPVVLIHGNV